MAADPAGWLAIGGHVLAHGRDPYFPPCSYVVQLNAFVPALRAAAADTLAGIAGPGDAIRCDMAMLMTSQVFARTWGRHAGPAPDYRMPAAVTTASAKVTTAPSPCTIGMSPAEEDFGFFAS
jgi:hypothetical protein